MRHALGFELKREMRFAVPVRMFLNPRIQAGFDITFASFEGYEFAIAEESIRFIPFAAERLCKQKLGVWFASIAARNAHQFHSVISHTGILAQGNPN